jgi:predicted acylesterase/phospholipase RssA
MTADQDTTNASGRGTDLKTLKETVDALKAQYHFGDARRLLEKALETLPKRSDESGYVWIEQQRALCTYKDTQLRPELRFQSALEILRGIGLFDPATNDPETLGLGGAVYKRMWEHDGDEAYLRASLGMYLKGWKRNPETDMGYCGVNAAYILDLLAWQAERMVRRTGGDDSNARQLREEARALRLEMLERIPAPPDDSKDYWSVVTIAEIHFGLGDYDKARDLLARARELAGGTWKSETTVIQLMNLARWRNVLVLAPRGTGHAEETGEEKQCREALAALLGSNLDAALGRFRGKVGLALSGGGFRAAFFHLGVMARLAEIDALRHVEVLSTVSGGSIVGAHYYLELKKLLESTPDQKISRQDYIDIVRRVQENFLSGVQRNLRVRILSNFGKNLRMILTDGYTRSHRIGELYEEEIYRKVDDGHSSQTPRIMPELLICPEGVATPQEFKPREQNWLRKAKAPALLLNTTSLNSGHNFHFTASWMGEPPGLTGAEVDMNVRHRRLYYPEAPTEETRDFRLGYAVSASACVPGLFDPLIINGLYPGRTIKLADGGVHDNQGTAGLLDECCDFIICSDASGQMHDQAKPAGNFIGVPLRSNDILMDRVRECAYDHLETMSRSGRIKGLFFVHLKKDLAQEDIAWVGCPESDPPSQPNQTPYGIDRDIQRCLAEIRTDLDSFTDVEAFSLMLSGYLMAEEHAKALDASCRANGGIGPWGGFDIYVPRGDWPFLKLAPIAAKPCNTSDLRRIDLEKQLTVGKELVFKAWKLVPWLIAMKYVLIVLLAVSVVALGWLVWEKRDTVIGFTTWEISVAVILFLASLLLPSWVVLSPRKAGKERLVKICIAFLGWIAAWVHLAVIDPAFLRHGRVERLLRLPGDEG